MTERIALTYGVRISTVMPAVITARGHGSEDPEKRFARNTKKFVPRRNILLS